MGMGCIPIDEMGSGLNSYLEMEFLGMTIPNFQNYDFQRKDEIHPITKFREKLGWDRGWHIG